MERNVDIYYRGSMCQGLDHSSWDSSLSTWRSWVGPRYPGCMLCYALHLFVEEDSGGVYMGRKVLRLRGVFGIHWMHRIVSNKVLAEPSPISKLELRSRDGYHFNDIRAEIFFAHPRTLTSHILPEHAFHCGTSPCCDPS